LVGEAKRAMSPISASDRVAEHPGDARHRHQQWHVGVVGAERLELCVDVGDLGVEVVDHRDGGEHTAAPRLGKLQTPEQLAPAAAKQVRDRAGVAERQQLRVDAVLERAALADQEQPPAGPLPLGALLKPRQPDRRHQLATRQLGQHPRIDPIGLAGQRRQPLDLLGVGDLDLPALPLERVVHKPRTVHRLNRRPHRDRPMTLSDAPRQPGQAIAIRRRRTDLHTLATLAKQTEVQPPATEIQTSMQHEHRPPSEPFPR
jgi:hypothetical protein